MTYLVLARKYRPYTFQQMVGQEHVLRALINTLEQQRLHHAYLFTGTRGVGKTTVARIFAKCLNCETGMSSSPCGQCLTCQEIEQGRYIDLIEVDAASRTKVEDTRELLENVQYMPQRGRYKIYLIDEVHMLSTHSFNALLKTLEEPPPHVKFLLATTDPQRLPVTVLSRCLQFHLKPMSQEQIATYLVDILNKENINFEETALQALAQAAQGSMRDALSLLDQSIAHGGGKVQTADVTSMLGVTGQEKILELLSILAQRDNQLLLKKISTLAEAGADFHFVLDEMLAQLQQIALAQLIGESSEAIQQLAKQLSAEDVQLYYQIGLIGKRDLPYAPNPQTGFTMTIIRMLAFTPTEAPSSTPVKKTNQFNQSPHSNLIEVKSTTLPKVENILDNFSPASLPSKKSKQWADILPALKLSGIAQLLASNCVLSKLSEDTIELILDQANSALLNASSQARIAEALQNYMKKPCKVSITIGKPTSETPSQTQQRLINEEKEAAQHSLTSDPHVQVLMQKFSATIQSDTIITNDNLSIGKGDK